MGEWTSLKRISIPESVKDTAECVIKNSQQGEVGEKFKAWNKTCIITAVRTVQSRDASKLYKDCGYKTPQDWKMAWLEHHLFPPNADDIVYAHYFEEVE